MGAVRGRTGLLALGSWLRWLLRVEGSPEQADWLTSLVEAIGFAGIPVVGALIASRLPANPYGWIWCMTGLVYGLAGVARPVVLLVDGPLWVAWTLEVWSFVTLLGLFAFVFLLFPTGRLPSRGWRWLARAVGTVALLLLLVGPLTSTLPTPQPPAPGRCGARPADISPRPPRWAST